MTKIEIYNGNDEAEQEPVLRLALRRYADGVMVVAVDEYGNQLSFGRLVEFTADGYIRRRRNVSPAVPVMTDSLRRIRLTV